MLLRITTKQTTNTIFHIGFFQNPAPARFLLFVVCLFVCCFVVSEVYGARAATPRRLVSIFAHFVLSAAAAAAASLFWRVIIAIVIIVIIVDDDFIDLLLTAATMVVTFLIRI